MAGQVRHKGSTTPRKATAPSFARFFSALFLAQDAREPRLLFTALTVGVVLFTGVISYCNIRSLDLGWHLKTGEWIWAERAIPYADPFSYSAAGKPWVSHEWLFGLLSYVAYRIGGTGGLVLGKCLLIGLLFLLAAWCARLRGAKAGIIFLILAALYPMIRLRLLERPELVSSALALGFLAADLLSRKRPRAILAWPLLELFWANTHGGTALFGWLLAGALFAQRAWELRAASIDGSYASVLRQLRWNLAALLSVPAAALLNPHGHHAILYGLLRTKSPLDNKEFQSFFQIASHGIDLSLILFCAFALVLGALLILRWKEAPVSDLLLFASLCTVTLIYFRFRLLFAFALAPSLAGYLSRGDRLSRHRWWLPALLGTWLLAYSVGLERETYFYRFGSGIHPGVFPVRAADFIRSAGTSGRMFNSYGLGGYLVWTLWPNHKVFIDGREDVYLEPGVLEEYTHCFDSRESWEALEQKYGFDFAVVRYPEAPPSVPQNSLDVLAFRREKWALVYFDDTVAIYLRRSGANASMISTREIRLVQPLQVSSYLDSIVKDSEMKRTFLDEMRANRAANPGSFRNHFVMGMFAVKQGAEHLGEALREFERAAALNPDFAPAHINLGSLYLHFGRSRDAERAFNKALAIEENPLAREQLRKMGTVTAIP